MIAHIKILAKHIKPDNNIIDSIIRFNNEILAETFCVYTEPSSDRVSRISIQDLVAFVSCVSVCTAVVRSSILFAFYGIQKREFVGTHSFEIRRSRNWIWDCVFKSSKALNKA